MEYFFSLRGALIAFLILTLTFWIFAKPKVGVSVIFAVIILRAGFLEEWFPPIYDLHIPMIVILLVLFAWVLHMGSLRLIINKDIIFLILFFGVICLSRFLSGEGIMNNKIFDECLRTVIVFVLIVQLIRTPKDLRILLWVISILHLFLVLKGYYNYKTDYMDIAMPNYFTMDRNDYANSLVFVFPIAYTLGRQSKRFFLRYLGYFIAAACAGGVILTYSRGGLIALVMASLALMFFEKKKKNFVIGIVIALVLVLPRLSDKYLDRIHSIEDYQVDASAMGRVATYKGALNMFKSHPFLGVGAGNFNEYVTAYTPSEYWVWIEDGKSIHNAVLQVASETGFVGLFIFIILVGRGLWITLGCLLFRRIEEGELQDLAIMLGSSLFGLFVGLQFIPGAYYGNLYSILPLVSAYSMMVSKKELS